MNIAGRLARRIPRGPRPGALRRNLIAFLAALMAGGGVTAMLHADGYSASSFDFGTGAVWLASTRTGELTLLDGASGAVVTSVRVAEPDQELVAYQGESAGYAVLHKTGTIVRVDGATWEVTAKKILGDQATNLQLAVTDDALVVVDPDNRLLAEADPVTLEALGTADSLPAAIHPDGLVADREGGTWFIATKSGDILRHAEDVEVTAAAVTSGERSSLVLVNGHPVVVDLAANRLIPLDVDTGKPEAETCLALDSTDTSIRVAGSSTQSAVYAASGRDGSLRIADLTTHDCTRVITDIAPRGSDLGRPVESGGRLYVPDRGRGLVVIVDPVTGTVIPTTALVDAGGDLQLVSRDGFVFYNDPTGNRAGVIREDGTSTEVLKYEDGAAPDDGANATTPGPEPDPQPNNPTDQEPDPQAKNPLDQEPDQQSPSPSEQRPEDQGHSEDSTTPGTPEPTEAPGPDKDPRSDTSPDGTGGTTDGGGDGGSGGGGTVGARQVDLTVLFTGDGDGDVTTSEWTCNKAGPTCVHEYGLLDPPRTVVLTAIPRGNAQVTWNCPGQAAATTCVVSMREATTVIATFSNRGDQSPKTADLTVLFTGAGDGTVTAGDWSCPKNSGPCIHPYEIHDPATQVTLFAQPADGAAATWTCPGGVIAEEACTIKMNQAQSVAVRFTPPDPVLTVRFAGGGSGRPLGEEWACVGGVCTRPVSWNTDHRVDIEFAEQGSYTWSDCDRVFEGRLCEVTMMTKPRTVTVTFTPDPVLTVRFAGGGSGKPLGEEWACVGGVCTRTVPRNTPYQIAVEFTDQGSYLWSDCDKVLENGTCEVTMSKPRTVTATFTPDPVLTVRFAGSGSGTVQGKDWTCDAGVCTRKVKSGETVPVTVEFAEQGSYRWSDCDTILANGDCQVTLTTARTVTATFTPDPVLTVRFAGAGAGQVLPDGWTCSGTGCWHRYKLGEPVRLQAKGADGAGVEWAGCDSQTAGICVISALNLSTDVTVHFMPPACQLTTPEYRVGPVTYMPPWDPSTGDREFFGKVDITIKLTLLPTSDYIDARLSMSAVQPGDDHTTAAGETVFRFYTAPAGQRIKQVVGPLEAELSYRDTTWEDDIFGGGGGIVAEYRVRGDHNGPDAGIWTQVELAFNVQKVQLVATQNCV